VRKYSLMAGVAAVVFAAPAFAADFPTKSMPIVAAPEPTWTGFYIGLDGGYGWGRDRFADPLDLSGPVIGGLATDTPTPIGGVNLKGWLFGGHAGYNWQSGRWVGGLEADLDAANIKGMTGLSATTIDGNTFVQSNSTKFDALATLRVRLGLLVTPDLLVYGTGGGAAGHATNFASGNFNNGLFADSYTAGQTLFGWSAGGGVEGKLTSIGLSNVTLRVEYLHYGFLSEATPFANIANPVGGFTLNHGVNIDVVRGGLTWQFTSASGRY
jgi:opacity protein-like surface antigen